MNILNKLVSIIAVAAPLTLFPSVVGAAVFNELDFGEAGDSIATALSVGPGFDEIEGVIEFGDSDLYELRYATPILLNIVDIEPRTGQLIDLVLRDDDLEPVLGGECLDCFYRFGEQDTIVISSILEPDQNYYLEVSFNYDENGSAPVAYEIGLEPAPAPVPVPAALPLFVSALAGMGFMARRRKQAV